MNRCYRITLLSAALGAALPLHASPLEAEAQDRTAIELADKGFPVSETLAKILQQEKKNMGQWPATQAIFWKNGEPLKVGDALVQKDLAQSMRLIGQQGAKAFYEGEIAQKIAAVTAPVPSPMAFL